MSEINENAATPEELNDDVVEEIDDAEVVTVPIDDTLSISGEAADAAAVGAALAEKADRSELQTQVKVNGQSADAQGLIILLASHIPVSDSADAQTISQVLTTLLQRTGADIKIDGTPNAETIAQAISSATGRTADAIKMSSASDAQTVAQAMAALAEALSTQDAAITALDAKTGSTIKLTTAQDSETIAAAIQSIRQGRVLKVNGIGPNASGDVILVTVPYAENLASADTTEGNGTFIRRTTAGDVGIRDGSAWLNRMLGNSRHDGFVAESITLNVIPVQRPMPAGISAELDKATFIAYVQQAGTYTLNYTSGAWSATPATYGVTVGGLPENGDSITITWDGENDPVMTVSSPREPEEAITATIDRDTFVAAVDSSGTYNLYFTTEWSEDPADYGIMVTGTPAAGDQLQVIYVKEVRGTITQATPTALVSTGWNLYDGTSGYARVLKYSETYGYLIGGTYTSLVFKEALTDEGTSITPDADGKFSVSADGYVVVTGGSTDTYILATESDWDDGPDGSYEAYSESSVSLATIMANCFPYGLMKVGTAQDEIDRYAGLAISRVERQAYSAESRAAADASGRQYDFDEDYIYIERASAVETVIALDGEYTVNDHGQEYIAGTEVPVYCEIVYGESLKDKLRREVITIRKQTFTAGQQAQARENIGAASLADTADLANEIGIVVTGNKTASGVTASIGQYVILRESTITGKADGLYKAAKAIPAATAIDGTYLTAVSGGLGAEVATLNSNLNTANTKISHIDTRVSLIIGADATSTTQSFNTYNGRKFSDYRMLVFYLYNSNSDKSQIRNCIMLPQSAWTSGKSLFLLQNHGVNMANISGIMFSYDSDTSIKAMLQGGGNLTGFAIEAYMNI